MCVYSPALASTGDEMQGFDPKFRDLPDFIIGITKEIWEDRGVETLKTAVWDYWQKLNHVGAENVAENLPKGLAQTKPIGVV